VNAATIRELLPFAVEDRLLGDPSNIHAVAGRRGEKGDTTIASMDRAWFADMLATLGRAGLKARHARSESDLAPCGAIEWNIAWGSEHSLLVDDHRVAVAFDRSGDDLPLAVRLALDEATARNERPKGVCVRAAGGEKLPDIDRWSADTGVIFMEAEPWEWVRVREPEWSAIDLLQGEFAPRSSRASLRQVPMAAAWLAAIIAVAQVSFVGIDAWRLERERQALETKREAIFRTAFPEAKAVVDPDLQMQRNVAELRRARGLATDDDFLGQLTRAAREGPPARSIEYTAGRLQVRR